MRYFGFIVLVGLLQACGTEQSSVNPGPGAVAPDASGESEATAPEASGESDADSGAKPDAPPDGGWVPTSRDFHEKVPMRDGVRLDTRIVLPAYGTGPWPTLLLRSPYLLGGSEAHVGLFGDFTKQGYAFVIQACRGTADSEGVLQPLIQEFNDGHDTVQALAKQPWSNGRVGTIGASYEGFTALAAAIDTPEVQVVIADGAISRAFAGWPGIRGFTTMSGMLWWWTAVNGMPDPMNDPAWAALVSNQRPVSEHDVGYFGEQVSQWRDLLPHLDADSPFWEARSLVGRLGKLCTPTLHIQAKQEWEDDPLAAFLDQQGGECTAAQKAAQRFILGSHSHGVVMYSPFEATPPSTMLREYLDRYLKDVPGAFESSPRVHYCVDEGKTWATAPNWPPTDTFKELYLAPDALSVTVPQAGSADLAFDPAKESPCDEGFSTYQIFSSAPLGNDLELAGRAQIRLNVKTQQPDADIITYLATLSPTNTVSWLTFSKLKLRHRHAYAKPEPMSPGVPEQVTLEFPAITRRIPAGHSLVLYLTPAECGTPENTHTGGPVASETKTLPNVTTIQLGGSSPSLLRLPVVEH